MAESHSPAERLVEVAASCTPAPTGSGGLGRRARGGPPDGPDDSAQTAGTGAPAIRGSNETLWLVRS
jgi:hypothetical protein